MLVEFGFLANLPHQLKDSICQFIFSVNDEVFTFAEKHYVVGLGYARNGGQGPFDFSNLRRPSRNLPAFRHEPVGRLAFVVDGMPGGASPLLSPFGPF